MSRILCIFSILITLYSIVNGWGPAAEPEYSPAHPEPVEWVITPPPSGPGPVPIPGIQQLGECKNTINWCLTDDKAQGLINFYFEVVDTKETDICKLIQGLFGNCLGEINCRTCTIQVLNNGGAKCNVFNAVDTDLLTAINYIHLGFANASTILPFINTQAVRQLIQATNRWCPDN